MDLRTWLRAQWDRVLAWLLVLAGLVALLLGWRGVSSTPYLAEQLPYLVSAGMFGLFLLGLGATVWISADLRDEWRKLDELAELLADRGPADDPGEAAPVATPSPGKAPRGEAPPRAGAGSRVTGSGVAAGGGG